MEQKSLELDVCYPNDGLGAVLYELTEGLESITYRIVALSGPAGSWPVVRFAGDWHDIVLLVARYYESDIETRNDVLKALTAA